MINIGGHAHLKGLSRPKLSRSQRMRTMVSASFMGKPPNPDPIPWNTILWSSHVPGYHHPALITPSRDTKQLGTALTPQNLLKLFELANPRPAHLAWPAPSCRNPNEGSTYAFPSILLPPDQPWWLPVWPVIAHSLLSGSVSTTSCLFSGNVSWCVDLAICK